MNDQNELTITRDTDADTNNSIVAVVVGRVDSATSPELDSKLQEYAGHRKNVILDVHQVSYMSSAGIRALVAAQRTTSRNGRKIVLVHPSARVMDVLQLAGLTSIFEIYDSVGAAVGVMN